MSDLGGSTGSHGTGLGSVPEFEATVALLATLATLGLGERHAFGSEVGVGFNFVEGTTTNYYYSQYYYHHHHHH